MLLTIILGISDIEQMRPDCYEGVHASFVEFEVRDETKGSILPTEEATDPFLPIFLWKSQPRIRTGRLLKVKLLLTDL